MSFVKPKRYVNKVFIHCSASDLDAHDDISVIKRWHVQENGWNDVGYHFFITRNGSVQTGRSLESTPAAQAPYNKGTIAICVHGNAKFTDKQLRSLKSFCREINKSYQGNITYHGHCEISSKSCPNFKYKILLELDEKGNMA